MNPTQWKALALVLALLTLTATTLARLGANQRLGRPGVKLVPEPTYITGGQMVRTQSVGLPVEVPEFTSEAVEVTPLEVNWLPKDTLFGRRLYHSQDGFTNLISIVVMGSDRTSIHKPQFCLDSQGWRIEKSETVGIPIHRPHPYELKAMKLTSSKSVMDSQGRTVKARGIYVYWFVADNELTASHGQRMWWMARDLIRTGVLQRWAYVGVFTVCLPGQEDSYFARLKDLVAAVVPEFQLATGPVSAVGSTAAVSDNGSARSKN